MIDIRHSNDAAEIRRLASEGFEPVECSIDGESIVGPLELDHHGPRSHLEGVAIRAYRDHLGARAADPRFVVTGSADADATFAVASVAGLLPGREERDLSGLADLINVVDTDPLSVDLPEVEWGDFLLLFQALTRSPEDASAFHLGAHLWRQLVASPPTSLLHHAADLERERLERARQAEVLLETPRLRVVSSDVWGFDVWYGRQADHPSPSRADAWRAPVVVSYDPQGKSVTVGCPNEAVAQELFGEQGLLSVWSRLEPPGWGGRPTIGGSPRGRALSVEQALAAAQALASLLRA